MKIVLTGGGSSGHVNPLLSVAAELVASGLPTVGEPKVGQVSESDLVWLGSSNGPERDLVMRTGIAFYEMQTGKLRRYLDWRNLTDPFRIPVGVLQALRVLRKFKPHIILSSGGNVSIPAAVAASILRIPFVLYEPNVQAGLATTILMKRAKKICLGFPDLGHKYPSEKIIVTGHPVRPEIQHGAAERGYAKTGFTPGKPVLLVIGGSQGAHFLNELIRYMLPSLTFCNVVHLCGPGNLTKDVGNSSNYVQYEYLHEDLADIYAITTVALSRAGANSIAELAAWHIPGIYIPLPKTASDGHQLANAELVAKRGAGIVIEQESLHESFVVDTLQLIMSDGEKLSAMRQSAGVLANPRAAKQIADVLRNFAKQS